MIIDSGQMWAWIRLERCLTIQRLVSSFKLGTLCPLRAFQKMLGLIAATTSVILLGLLHMQPIQLWLKACVPSHAWHLGWFYIRVTHCCIRAIAPWITLHLFQSGVLLGLTSKSKVVTTDVSNSGWRALFEGNLAFGSCSVLEQ